MGGVLVASASAAGKENMRAEGQGLARWWVEGGVVPRRGDPPSSCSSSHSSPSRPSPCPCAIPSPCPCAIPSPCPGNGDKDTICLDKAKSSLLGIQSISIAVLSPDPPTPFTPPPSSLDVTDRPPPPPPPQKLNPPMPPDFPVVVLFVSFFSVGTTCIPWNITARPNCSDNGSFEPSPCPW